MALLQFRQRAGCNEVLSAGYVGEAKPKRHSATDGSQTTKGGLRVKISHGWISQIYYFDYKAGI